MKFRLSDVKLVLNETYKILVKKYKDINKLRVDELEHLVIILNQYVCALYSDYGRKVLDYTLVDKTTFKDNMCESMATYACDIFDLAFYITNAYGTARCTSLFEQFTDDLEYLQVYMKYVLFDIQREKAC